MKALCSASYIDDASQQMTIGAATSSWDVLKSILSDVVTKIKTYAFGRTLRMPLYFPPLKSGKLTNKFLFVYSSMLFSAKCAGGDRRADVAPLDTSLSYCVLYIGADVLQEFQKYVGGRHTPPTRGH